MYLVGINKQNCLIIFFLKIPMATKLLIQIRLLITLMIFCTNIGTKLANKISSPDSNYVSTLKSKNQQNSIFVNPTNPDEIIKITEKS